MGDLRLRLRLCDDSVSESIGCRSNLLPENLLLDEYDQSDSVLQEIDNLHIQDTICSSVSNPKKLLFSSPPTTALNDFNKCAVLCSEILQSCPSKVVAEAKLPTIEAGYNGTIASNPYEASVMPLHVCTKLVSALKGHRAQQGKPLNPNMHVTWATDVYDPPATSSSHTMKGHRLRQPKVKEHHKHRHAKAKPSHSSSGDKKRSHRRNIDTRMARPQALSSRSLQQICFGHSKVQIPDIAAASSRESVAASCCVGFLTRQVGIANTTECFKYVMRKCGLPHEFQE